MTPTLFTNGRFLLPGSQNADPRSLLSKAGLIEAFDPADPPASAEVVDLQGRTVIPGPIDAHCHLVSYGMIQRREAELRGAASLEEIAARLRAHAERLGLRAGDGRWLLGRGFDQEILPGRRFPTRHDLDRLFPGIPLRITRVCGHAMVASTPALEQAGIDPAASAPFPEGVLTEERMGPIYAAVPAPTDSDWLEAARWACAEAARVGFVGVHSLMAHAREVRALVQLREEGPLPVRVIMQLPYSMLAAASDSGLRSGFGDDTLSIGAVKLFSDGSLGARTAALFEPYADDPTTMGELIYEPQELARRVTAIFAAGFQACIHAIGDRAMAVTLDAIAAGIEAERAAGRTLRLPARIEHASLVDDAIVRRMLELGVGAAIQPQFARSDYWSPDRLGTERARGCYAFRTLQEAGVPLAGSTDCPVETLDAMAAISQLVDRPEWSPDERLPLEDVLRIFSEGAYRINGAPPGTGALAPGQPADFVVLDADPRTVSPSEVERIPVAMTVVGGRVVYS